MLNSDYDFYGMGVRVAHDVTCSLNSLATRIGEIYGEDARLNFEAGIASSIPSYSSMNVNSKVLDNEIEKATTHFSVDNTRNNSYFGESGTSFQFKLMPNGEVRYNDPHKNYR